MMVRAALLALALTVAAVAPAEAKVVRLQMPSKRIACLYDSAGRSRPFLRCDLFFLNDRAVLLEAGRRARRIKVTDTVGDPAAPVLRYGTSRRLGRFTCTSRTTGLTCRDRRTRHGFSVSRERQRVF